VSADVLAASLLGCGEGAIVTFEGRVRGRNREREVERLEYEAYEEMGGVVLEEIAARARDRFSLNRVRVTHRVGVLSPGEVALAVAVSAAHRAEAFDAARWIVEQIKARLPIWKHEVYADGSSQWVEGTAPAPEDAGGAE
jgi:molybdopterin synthase catalytic subunit